MTNRVLVLLGVLAASAVLAAPEENSSPPAIYKSAQELMATLAKNAEAHPDSADAPISNQAHYRVNIVRRGSPGFAMAHIAGGPAPGSELHYILDGAATVVTGGKIVGPPGAGTRVAGPAKIEGGESRRVTKGDVIFIPLGTPHWYKEVEGSVTYLEVRFDVPLGK
jgi:hypothetical protein